MSTPEKPRVITMAHTLRELPNGWLHKEWGRIYKTASSANRALNAHERHVSQGASVSVVSIRDWQPATAAGRAAVAAVAGAILVGEPLPN